MKIKAMIDEINFTTTIIKTYKNNELLETATGFFYKKLKNNSCYLITNKHVVQRDEYNPD